MICNQRLHLHVEFVHSSVDCISVNSSRENFLKKKESIYPQKGNILNYSFDRIKFFRQPRDFGLNSYFLPFRLLNASLRESNLKWFFLTKLHGEGYTSASKSLKCFMSRRSFSLFIRCFSNSSTQLKITIINGKKSHILTALRYRRELFVIHFHSFGNRFVSHVRQISMCVVTEWFIRFFIKAHYLWYTSISAS